MRIKPRPGRTLLIPNQGRRTVPDEGMDVPDDVLHWHRCVSLGDAEIVEPDDAPQDEDTAAAATSE